jgi:hypothetical protein
MDFMKKLNSVLNKRYREKIKWAFFVRSFAFNVRLAFLHKYKCVCVCVCDGKVTWYIRVFSCCEWKEEYGVCLVCEFSLWSLYYRDEWGWYYVWGILFLILSFILNFKNIASHVLLIDIEERKKNYSYLFIRYWKLFVSILLCNTYFTLKKKCILTLKPHVGAFLNCKKNTTV